MDPQAAYPVWADDLVYFVFLTASAAILVRSAFLLWQKIRSRAGSEAGRSFQIFTLQALAAAAVMFVPVYLKYHFGDRPVILRPLLLALHNAMRMFILDGEYDVIRDSIANLSTPLHLMYSCYASVLYVAAPMIFTFTVFLSIFQDAFEHFQYRFHRDSPLYVFSCLNSESAAMARSIMRKNLKSNEDGAGKGGKRKSAQSVIVFCSLTLEEADQERLACMVPDLPGSRTLVLSEANDVSHFITTGFRNRITFFLMDRNESNNIEDASALCAGLKARSGAGRHSENRERPEEDAHPSFISWMCERPASPSRPRAGRSLPERRILVYASSAASVPLIDALSRDIRVPGGTVAALKEIVEQARKDRQGGPENMEAEYRILNSIREKLADKQSPLPFCEPFSIMRVDSEGQMAMRIVRDLNDTSSDPLIGPDTEHVTVTLLGLGGIGTRLLENILWMYQQYGCRLTINVFDSVAPLPGTDPSPDPLSSRLSYLWPEVISTNALWQADPKAHPDTESEYDIRFFPGTDCFGKRFLDCFGSPDTAERLLRSDLVICALGDDDRNLEAALMLRRLFAGKNDPRTGESLHPDICAVVYDDQKSKNFSPEMRITNYREEPYDILVKGSMSEQYDISQIDEAEEEEKQALIYHIQWILAEKTGPDEIGKELNKYIHYDYFRRSSMAKAAHKRSLVRRGLYPPRADSDEKWYLEHEKGCRCDICRARITEHMRWNAFMRVDGYRYGKKRNDLAKIHHLLLPWDELSFRDQVKD